MLNNVRGYCHAVMSEVIVAVMTALATGSEESVGTLVKRWRERRRRSQLHVSLAAGISARHLSYIETGRSKPSREMIERICEELEVPLRQRNRFHLTAGFAPMYPEHAFADLGVAKDAVHAVLTGLEPNPAVAVNVRWDVLATNDAMRRFLDGLPDKLSRSPLNMLRATLHPEGLAPQVVNLEVWRAHVLRRVRRQWERTAAEGLCELISELEGYCAEHPTDGFVGSPDHHLVVPLQLSTPNGDLELIYAATVFGSARDVTLDEIAIETFFPADVRTAQVLRALAGTR